MEDKNSQKELFNFEDKPRRVFPDLAGLLPRADLEGKIAITLTLEKMIFITITIMLLMIVVFAFGVERGKVLVRPPISIATPAQGSAMVRTAVPAKNPPPAVTQQAATLQSTAIRIKTVPIAKVSPKQQGALTIYRSSKPYTIIAAAFVNKGTAAQEMNRLKKDGFDALIVQSGRFFKICVGAYADKESAQAALKRVKQRYKDAYIKLR